MTGQALGAPAELLTPATKRMPSATDVDVQGERIDRALRARLELVGLMWPALDAVHGNASANDALTWLRTNDAEALETFMGTVAACYYMHPGVRKRIGYPGQNAVLIAEGEADYRLDGGQLSHLVDRGSTYPAVP